MVFPKTLATWVHIAEHQEYAAGMKQQQMMQQQAEMGSDQNQPINQDRLSPMSATAPLKQEMQSSTQPLA